MGLDTSHDCFHGAYSSFTRWRNELAAAAGYVLLQDSIQDVMAGLSTSTSPYVDLDWSQFPLKNYQGEWDTVPGDDPLIYLIVHSDCDGVIHPEQGRHIALRLRELLPKLRDDGEGHLARYGVRGTTERFIAGLERAAEAGEDVDFH